jgi:hypothetical protein
MAQYAAYVAAMAMQQPQVYFLPVVAAPQTGAMAQYAAYAAMAMQQQQVYFLASCFTFTSCVECLT